VGSGLGNMGDTQSVFTKMLPSLALPYK